MSQAELHEIQPEPAGENVIARLEEALEAARAGKLSSVALAIVYRDGCTGSGWSDIQNWSLQIGAIVLLQAQMLRAYEG